MKNSDAMVGMLERLTFGKLYEHGIASVNHPNFINHLKSKKQKEDKESFQKECRRYIFEKKKWDNGQQLMGRLPLSRVKMLV
jgi:hypothetical protein